MAQKAFLASSLWGSSDQTYRFINEGFWTNNDIESFYSVWERVEKNDLLILYQSTQSEQLTLQALGYVDEKSTDRILIKWKSFKGQYKIKIGRDKSYFADLVLLEDKQINKISKMLPDGPLKEEMNKFIRNDRSKNEIGKSQDDLTIEENDHGLLTKGSKSFIDVESYDSSIQYDQSKVFLAEYKVGSEDMSSKFLRESKWYSYGPQNRTPYINDVNRGDILILKSCTADENHLSMTIKALGVVLNDDYTSAIEVKWEPINTVIEVQDIELFTLGFAPLLQEYKEEFLGKISAKGQGILDKIIASKNFWVRHVDVSQSNQQHVLEKIQKEIDSNSTFWWHNDKEKTWGLHTFREGKTYGLPISKPNPSWRIGELILLYDVKGTQSVHGIFELTNFLPSKVEGKLIYEFEKKPLIHDLEKIQSFNNSRISQNLRTPLIELTPELFLDIINVTELDNLNQSEDNDVEWVETPPGIDALYDNDTSSNPSKIPQNRNDLAKGEDYLGIDKDVTAFAKIIASNNFTPPLAIALFGEWGSGKSFFMNKLQDRIDRLSQSDANLYSGGVVHIQFNAWSYVDANLWASIVSRIFEGLNNYINDESSVAEENKEEVEKELSRRLKVLSEERKNYQDQKQILKKKSRL
uniref:P-loop NTPase fold protein n=1 Tax=Microscilla sp. PRE1 TaxID=155537 RepID=UPI00146F7A28|nr:P-loop NTPase fold protein [Microscilla sp. PRE1]